MATPQAASGDVVTAGPLGAALAGAKTQTLLRAPELDVVRLVIPAGKAVAEHSTRGAITVHCLEGVVDFEIGPETRRLDAGQLLYLAGAVPHALRGVADASVLVTILRG